MGARKKSVPVALPPENRCAACESLCCRYIAVHVRQPRHRDEYELVRWYLAHEGVCVYIDDEADWMVQVATPCTNLVDHRCAIYPRRPKVCREYENHSCEQAEGGGENIAEFTSIEEFERFFRANFRFDGDRIRRKHRAWVKP
jgi:Fe-S-cluster containining protein